MKIGFYPMVADILHTGHILAIENATKYCDYLIVGLLCNPSYKDPIQSIYERFIQLRSVKHIDEIIPYEDELDVITLLYSLDYDIYFVGEDYKDKDFAGFDVLKKLNKEIHYIPRKHNLSSTLFKEKIRGDSK